MCINLAVPMNYLKLSPFLPAATGFIHMEKYT